MNFKNQINHIKAKVVERQNLLKILSYDQHWKLNSEILVKMYKCLVRSIIEYSSIFITSISKSFIKKLESIQNESLRIIFRKSFYHDKISAEELRTLAKVPTIECRLIELKERYLKNAIYNENPLITQLVTEYHDFRNRNLKPKGLAESNELILELINKHNSEILSKGESIQTIICKTDIDIKKYAKSVNMPCDNE